MIGSIAGDIIGSRFEFSNLLSEHFKLFTDTSTFTDNTVCTVATMDWLNTDEKLKLEPFLKKWCKKYPNANYTPPFREWFEGTGKPPKSLGNDSSNRVSPIGLIAKSETFVRVFSEKSALTSHNHKEAVRGSQAIAMAIFHARHGCSKAKIKTLIEKEFRYKLGKTTNQMRKEKDYSLTTMVTVPQAIDCFLQSITFEDAIRKAISIGGDSDTIASMTGGIAGAYYNIPEKIRNQTLEVLPKDMKKVIDKFQSKVDKNKIEEARAFMRFVSSQ